MGNNTSRPCSLLLASLLLGSLAANALPTPSIGEDVLTLSARGQASHLYDFHPPRAVKDPVSWQPGHPRVPPGKRQHPVHTYGIQNSKGSPVEDAPYWPPGDPPQEARRASLAEQPVCRGEACTYHGYTDLSDLAARSPDPAPGPIPTMHGYAVGVDEDLRKREPARVTAHGYAVDSDETYVFPRATAHGYAVDEDELYPAPTWDGSRARATHPHGYAVYLDEHPYRRAPGPKPTMHGYAVYADEPLQMRRALPEKRQDGRTGSLQQKKRQDGPTGSLQQDVAAIPVGTAGPTPTLRGYPIEDRRRKVLAYPELEEGVDCVTQDAARK